MAYSGVNFRATSGYVTDGAGETYSLGEAYPTTRGGLTFGFGSSIAGNTRDRASGNDQRLAGIAFMANSGSPTTFALDLPNGAGTYNIRLGLGDASSGQDIYCQVKDGGTTLATIGPTATSGNNFLDATGTNYTNSGWPTNNTAIQHTFSGTTLTLALGGSSGVSGNTAIAHVAIEFVSGGGGAPTLTSPVGTATGSTTATIGATTDTGSGTIYGVVSTSATPPTTTQIAAGQMHTGSAAAFAGNTGTLTTTGAKTISATGLTASTTYYAHLYHDDASGDSAVVTSAAFITDVTAPTLSSAAASSATPLNCQASVSTNEGGGTLYTVFTASATAPSAAQVKAGQDHTGSAALRAVSQAVSGIGTQNVASGSITAGTRYGYLMHEDPAGNQSTVASSASFVVAAAYSITTDALEDEAGAVLASTTLTRAYAIRISDHTLVASWAAPVTNGSGQLVLSDAALTAVPHLIATVSNSNADAGAKVYTPA